MEQVDAPFARLVERAPGDQLRGEPGHDDQEHDQQPAHLGQRDAHRLGVVAQHRAHHVPVVLVAAQRQVLHQAEPARDPQAEGQSREAGEAQQEEPPETELVPAVGPVQAVEDEHRGEGHEDHALDGPHAVEQREQHPQTQMAARGVGEKEPGQQQQQQQIKSLEVQARRDHPEGHAEGQRHGGDRAAHDRRDDGPRGALVVVIDAPVEQRGDQQVEQAGAGDAAEGAERIQTIGQAVGREAADPLDQRAPEGMGGSDLRLDPRVGGDQRGGEPREDARRERQEEDQRGQGHRSQADNKIQLAFPDAAGAIVAFH